MERSDVNTNTWHSLLASHLKHSPLGIVEWDEAFRITRWGGAAKRIFGWTFDEVRGRSFEDFRFVHQDDWPEVSSIMRQLAMGETSFVAYRYRNWTKHGELKHCQWNNSVVHGANGKKRTVLSFVVDVSEEELTRQALQANERRLRLALEAGGMGTWEWQRERDTLEWSEGYYRLLGYFMGQVQPSLAVFNERVHPEDRKRVQQEWHEAMLDRRAYCCEYRVIWPNGSVHWIEGHGRYVYDAEGQAVRMFGLIMDISLRKQIEQDRQWVLQAERKARNEAERVSRLKDEFLATVSHELRTPLTIISGWTRLLLQGRAGEAKRALETVMRGAANLTQLVEDLLDMSHIISGQIRLEEQFADLTPIVRDTVESVMFAARAKSIGVDVFLDPDLLPIVCDRRRIQQVIWNLLTNAVKFTPAGGHVEICVAQAVETVEIQVSDTGQGISPDFIPYLFERFRQADGSTTRRHGGLGCGLAIVKHLVELHGGRVWAESEGSDKGSRFIVSLPRAGMVPVNSRSFSSSDKLIPQRLNVAATSKPSSLLNING